MDYDPPPVLEQRSHVRADWEGGRPHRVGGHDRLRPPGRDRAPHLRALATVVEPEQLGRLCREELQGRDLDVDGWSIKPRWFGIVVVATGRRGRTTGPATIEWRTFAEQLARR